ncbi:MAG: chemotaxis protein CheW [Burkholderiales bacterium]|nr:MAG: chemotaxis protein CheW [Burkholderiales bacterium]
MSTAPTVGGHQPFVLARIGGLHLGVPAAWVAGAHASREALTQLPRRQGAVTGLLPTPQGPVPVVDLGRWVTLPARADGDVTAVTEPVPCYLTLQQGGQRLAIQVDEVLGLRRVPAAHVQRIHHRDDPEELFDAVLPANAPDEPPVCVLEPQRLMRLLALWCDTSQARVSDAGDDSGRSTTASPRLALVLVAGRRLAVDMRHVAELMPMPSLKTRLAPGGASAGFAEWRGGTLPVLQAGALTGQSSTSTAPLALVVQDASGRALALPVDELLGMTSAPMQAVAPETGAQPWRGEAWTDDDGPVQALRVPELLDALPESALALSAARQAQSARASNDRPYFIFQSGRTAALPIDDVLAVVDSGPLDAHQQTLTWRGRHLPLRGVPTPGGVVVVLQGDAGAVALHVERLLGLVPAGAAEMSTLPGVPGGRMLHVPTQATSYAVARAADLVPV